MDSGVPMSNPQSTAFTLPRDAIPIFSDESREADVEPLRCNEPGCTNEIIKPARGRTPKFCPTHKQGTSNSSSRNKSAFPRAAEIEKLLSTYLLGIAGGLSLTRYAPDGTLLVVHGPAVVHEVVELARVDKKLRRILEIIATPGRYGPLAMALMPIIFGVLANHDLLPQFVVNVTAPSTNEKE